MMYYLIEKFLAFAIVMALGFLLLMLGFFLVVFCPFIAFVVEFKDESGKPFRLSDLFNLG